MIKIPNEVFWTKRLAAGRAMKEKFLEQVDLIQFDSGDWYKIIKVGVELEDGSECDWWKIFRNHSSCFCSTCGSIEFVSHAPSEQAAYNQLEQLKKGFHTHLGYYLAATAGSNKGD